jgi:hypothetical protein
MGIAAVYTYSSQKSKAGDESGQLHVEDEGCKLVELYGRYCFEKNV